MIIWLSLKLTFGCSCLSRLCGLCGRRGLNKQVDVDWLIKLIGRPAISWVLVLSYFVVVFVICKLFGLVIEDVRSHPWILSPSMDASHALANGSSMLIPVLWVIPK